jgi:predicted MFS family arabinose efflux permease
MCYGLAMVFMGPLISRFFNNAAHRKYYILTGGLIIGFSMLSFKIYSGFLPIIVIVTLLGLAHSISVSSQAAAIMETNIVKKMGTGVGMGAFRFWERVGNILGPIFMGFLIAKTDYNQAVFFLGAFLLLFNFFYFIVIFFNKKQT